MSIPKKHHFLPEFYQKRWCHEDGQCLRFSQPVPGKVVAERKHPSEIGFQEFLYSLRKCPQEVAQQIETNFFSPLDDRAAKALNHLIESGNLLESFESDWWRFVASLVVRMPSDIVVFRKFYEKFLHAVLPCLEQVKDLPEFEDRRSEIDHAREEIIERQIDTSLETLTSLISGDTLVPKLMEMHWQLISTAEAPHELLTSDRPVDFLPANSQEGFELKLPVGPNQLFIAAQHKFALIRMASMNSNALVREVNAAVVGNAQHYVIGSSRAQESFVRKRMGKSRQKSAVELMSEKVDLLLPIVQLGLQRVYEEHKSK